MYFSTDIIKLRQFAKNKNLISEDCRTDIVKSSVCSVGKSPAAGFKLNENHNLNPIVKEYRHYSYNVCCRDYQITESLLRCFSFV